MTEQVVPRRLINVVCMFLMTIIFTFVIGWLNGFIIDQMGCMFFLDLAYFMLFTFALGSSRSQKLIGNNSATSYRYITISYGASCVLAIVFSFLPEFTKPVILITILMSAFGTPSIAITVGIFMSSVLCLIGNASVHEMICYCLMCMFGCMLSDSIRRKKYQVWISMILFCLSIMVPCLIYYLYNMELTMPILIGSILDGCINVLVVLFIYRDPIVKDGSDIPLLLEEMVKEDYPMAQEIKQFSITEYHHAVRVSNVAYRCALVVGADERLTAAAGFYYRLGKLEGEPFVSNGVKLARNHFFPDCVVQILSEYGGEEALPSTVESAIVHMVDALVKKLEVMDKQTMQSEWNQDMLVYQTLNELSSQGIYDKSGMSMNLFLKIREHLVKEEGLL